MRPVLLLCRDKNCNGIVRFSSNWGCLNPETLLFPAGGFYSDDFVGDP